MSKIESITIKNFRGIKSLETTSLSERLIILIGRGDSGKSTILTAINYALSPAWNLSFSDLDFYNQDICNPIEINVSVSELPSSLLKDHKFGLLSPSLSEEDSGEDFDPAKMTLNIRLRVDDSLEPKWTVINNFGTEVPISATDRAKIGATLVADYCDNHFSYSKQSPLYRLTKNSLEGTSIEEIQTHLLRDLKSKYSKSELAELEKILEDLPERFKPYGLLLDEIKTLFDFRENTLNGSSLSLHSHGLPLRLQGKGTKRLISMGLQQELSKNGNIVLIDEVEQGLEPDRIVNLIKLYKRTRKGQIILSTHSSYVLIEAEANQLYKVVKSSDGTTHQVLPVSSEMTACRRTTPHAFFAKKIVCCEGKTEFGVMRSLDEWLLENKNLSLASLGVSYIDCGGGSKMYNFACRLKELNYETCVFADNDSLKDLHEHQKKAEDPKIRLFLCSVGNCIETQFFEDFDKEYIEPFLLLLSDEPLNRPEFLEDYKKHKDDFKTKFPMPILTKKIFKNIPGGEFLGKLILNQYGSVPYPEFSVLRNLLTEIENWSTNA